MSPELHTSQIDPNNPNTWHKPPKIPKWLKWIAGGTAAARGAKTIHDATHEKTDSAYGINE